VRFSIIIQERYGKGGNSERFPVVLNEMGDFGPPGNGGKFTRTCLTGRLHATASRRATVVTLRHVKPNRPSRRHALWGWLWMTLGWAHPFRLHSVSLAPQRLLRCSRHRHLPRARQPAAPAANAGSLELYCYWWGSEFHVRIQDDRVDRCEFRIMDT
jgi:hypothetical protein